MDAGRGAVPPPASAPSGMPEPEPEPQLVVPNTAQDVSDTTTAGAGAVPPQGQDSTATADSDTPTMAVGDGARPDESADSDAAFYRHARHIFVTSYAGKPIYSRHGSESRLATLMPMLTAIIDQYSDIGSEIQSISAGSRHYVFYKRDPLYLLAITSHSEPSGLLSRQLEYVYEQVVSLVTGTYIDALKENPKNDISRHIGGAEHVLHELVDAMDHWPCFLFNAWSCLPMDPSIRKAVTEAISKVRAEVAPDIQYGMIITKKRVATLLEPKQYPLHSTDLLLLINYLAANEERLRTSTTNFLQMCLPKTNDRGWHHVYINYVLDGVALVFVTHNFEAFDQLHSAQEELKGDLTGSGLLEELQSSIAAPAFSIRSLDMTPEFWHFMFKMSARSQVLLHNLYALQYECQ